MLVPWRVSGSIPVEQLFFEKKVANSNDAFRLGQSLHTIMEPENQPFEKEINFGTHCQDPC